MLYRFDECTLDTGSHELTRAGRVCRLRRKVFQALIYLLAQAERVVSKQELFDELWPELFITEAALESTIKAVRQAIGDNGRDQRLIKTMYGEGYRFVATVTREDPANRTRLSTRTTAVSARESSGSEGLHNHYLVVGREAEVAQLMRCFARAQEGARQLIFVSGEPGIGKTTLLEVFLGGMADKQSTWIGRGQCVEQFGAGEAYRPVLEAFGRLGRGWRGPELITLLKQHAPMWLAQLPGLLDDTEFDVLQRRCTGATRDRMLRELVEALERLTELQPLVLVLEDLHWSDPSTLELIAVLARRREPARLLLIGTYRSAEGQRQPHPLVNLLDELDLHGHSVELPVTLLTEADIATYLTRRFPGLQEVESLVHFLHQRTEGNPLFMVTLVGTWLAEGMFREKRGEWHLQPGAEAIRVPHGLRRMIEGRLERLSREDQRTLEAASVAGVEFPAAAVTAGLGQTLEGVDEACAALVRRGRWLQAVGDESWPDGTVSGLYRFAHSLYQEVLYRRIAAARRIRLHHRIGMRLEAGLGAQSFARAAQLAVHFEQGRDYARAAQYLTQSAENAMRRCSYQEAINHLRHGLALLPLMTDTADRTQQELLFQVALSVPLAMTKGYASAEVEQTFSRARTLCQTIGEAPQIGPILIGLARFYITRGEHLVGFELGQQCLRLAQRIHNPILRLQAHQIMGASLCFRGDCIPAQTHLDKGLDLYNPQEHRTQVLAQGEDPGIACLCFKGLSLCPAGYIDQALHNIEQALRLAKETSQPMNLLWVLHAASFVHQMRRERQPAQAQAEAMVSLGTDQGFTGFLGYGWVVRGWALAMQGYYGEGLVHLRKGVAVLKAAGNRNGIPYFLGLLAEAYATAGQIAAGLDALDEALGAVHAREEGFYEPELCRLRGELLLLQAQGTAKRKTGQVSKEVESCFQQAVAIARYRHQKLWELRALMSLGRLWEKQGKRAEARQLLLETYSWFTEGLNTPDLIEAKALLHTLGHGARCPYSFNPLLR